MMRMEPPRCRVGASDETHYLHPRYTEALCGLGSPLVGGPLRLLADRPPVTCARCLAKWRRMVGRDLPPAA